MEKKTDAALKNFRTTDRTPEATEKLLLSYCLAHPSSPSAVRRPQLSIRDDLWIALLGPSVEKGIVGIGPSVESALRAFDAQYLSFLKPSAAVAKIHDSASRG
jgi:hypothetical protein